MTALTNTAALLALLTAWARPSRRRPGRSRARTPFVAAVIGVAALLALPATASASPPDHGEFSSHEVFVDSEVCAAEGFSVDVTQDEVGTFRVFVDRSGEVSFIQVHISYQAVISANGHTIVERDTWTDTFYADGSARTVGDTVHIQGQGPGLVQHDAGQIVFGADGSVQLVRGPHPQFEGQTFRSALLPWGRSHLRTPIGPVVWEAGGMTKPERDRDSEGRARQLRPRDALGRPLPYGTEGVEPVSEDPLPPEEALAEARRLVDQGRPFAAHEVLEARWKAGPAEEGDLWQGLAQVCVALTHELRGNRTGAERLFDRAAARLAAFAETGRWAHGVDVITAAEQARRHVASF